jgi:sucrose phosphorylase
MSVTAQTPAERISLLLHRLYTSDTAQSTYHRLMDMLNTLKLPSPEDGVLFSERDVTLITYGDTLRHESEAPLMTLHHFVSQWLKGTISTVHILPFYPYSSDDGFSVIDYYAVDPGLGTWEDVARLGGDFRLMFDAVINHMSAQSDWFKGFLADAPEYHGLFMTALSDQDLSRVTRPRTSPLLTPFVRSNRETVHVWTTFSDDQVDLDYRNPDTLLRIVDVLLFYVRQGARAIRLDAIAYAWKEVGTNCIHLAPTHALIQLLRAALDQAAPHVILITETNVPHAENVSYFGDGYDEAQMVYNFTLPPLLFHTMLSGNARQLSEWANTLITPSDRTAFFNFTASHDGIGVRPVEGILPPAELSRMINAVEERGGRVSYKANPDGSRSPYELNITYVDALSSPTLPRDLQVKCFLCSQAVTLALAGVPAIYIHSLIGSRNDVEGMRQTGHNRRINRAKLDIEKIEAELEDSSSFRAAVFHPYLHLIRTRIRQRAFHPQARQETSILNDGRVFVVKRMIGDEGILALFNVTSAAQTVTLEQSAGRDLLDDQFTPQRTITLEPYQTRWLIQKDAPTP